MARSKVLQMNSRSKRTPRGVTSVCPKAERPLFNNDNNDNIFLTPPASAGMSQWRKH